MVNSNLGNNAVPNSMVDSPIYQKQSTLRMKKAVLRDVQNDNRLYMPNHPDSSGREIGDPCRQFLSITGSCEQGVNKRKFQDLTERSPDFQKSKRHLQNLAGIPEETTKKEVNETACPPTFIPTFLTSPITSSPGNPPIPHFLGQSSNVSPGARSRLLKLTPDSLVSHLNDSKRENDENRAERFICLQNLLKFIDESNHGEYIQMLRCLSSSELSRHAVELEKRSMLLSVEEAQEIQRMKALNILVKSSTPSNSPLASECVQSKK